MKITKYAITAEEITPPPAEGTVVLTMPKSVASNLRAELLNVSGTFITCNQLWDTLDDLLRLEKLTGNFVK